MLTGTAHHHDVEGSAVDGTPHLESTTPPEGSAAVLPDGLIETDGLLDRLVTDHDRRPVAEHVQVFEAVHQALVDALAQTEI